MIRASYFHEISRLIFRIYLAEKHGVNKTNLDSILPADAPKEDIVRYLQVHPEMISEAKMVQRNEISSSLNRPIFL